jgi:hypothetical protein
VDKITHVILNRVMSLHSSDLLLPSSELTLKPDTTLIIRFLGDKGGPFMSSKFGLTVMNRRDANSPDSLDLCATLDAPDSYNNLRDGIFDHFKDELAFYFSLKNSPKLVIVECEDIVLCSYTYASVCGAGHQCWNHDIQTRTTDAIDVDAEEMGGPFTFEMDTTLTMLVSESLVWGIEFSNCGSAKNTVRFKKPISVRQSKVVSTKAYDLYCVLGGDIEYLHTVMGLQSCAATNPCYKCMEKLERLRNFRDRTDDQPADLRTSELMKSQLEQVEMKGGLSVKAQKAEAKRQGSVYRKPLIPADPSRLLIAILHIILGITKLIFDEYLGELQVIDNADEANERQGLTRIRDELLLEIGDYKMYLESLQAELTDATIKKQSAWENLQAAMKEMPPDVTRIAELRSEHRLACESLKEVNGLETDKEETAKKKDALEKMVEEISTYLKVSRGRYESCVEDVISKSPINAQHNPFYNGAFNGNDGLRLIQNYKLLFTSVRANAESEIDESLKERVLEVAGRHEMIFESWGSVVPYLRSTKLLPETARLILLADVNTFIDTFVTNTTKGRITVKVHHLLHLEKMLEEFGTAGFFAEDAIESIHAIVNVLCRRYASLDKRKKILQIHRALEQRKKTTIKEQKERKKDGNEKKKRSRVQGKLAEDIVFLRVEDTKLRDSVVAFLDLLDEQDLEDEEGEHIEPSCFPTFELQRCGTC